MSDAGCILEGEAGAAARRTIERPAKSNALSAILLLELGRRLRRLAARQELSLLILKGRGLRICPVAGKARRAATYLGWQEGLHAA